MPDTIELLALSPGDWATWRTLRLAALAEAPHAFGSTLADWLGERDREERWRDRLSIPGSRNVVAIVDGVPAGMASGIPTDDSQVTELISMWVAPAARGLGIGGRLIDDIVTWSRACGAHEIRLAVVDGNHAATALYERHGFSCTSELGDLMADGVRRERVMTKQLS